MGEQKPDSSRILLVDDEQDVRSTLRLVLDSDHHAVVEAGNGLEALERFKEGRFDLVITDYLMPELSGDRLVVELRKQCPGIPVIMITANADLLPANVPGVDILLSKPFSIVRLREAIHKLTRAGATT